MKASNYDQLNQTAPPNCPLCGSINVLSKTRIDTGSIAEIYGKGQQELVRQGFQGTSWINVYHCQNCFLLFFEPKISGSPAFYKRMQSYEWYYQKDKAEYKMAQKWIPLNARVLE